MGINNRSTVYKMYKSVMNRVVQVTTSLMNSTVNDIKQITYIELSALPGMYVTIDC